MAFIPYLQRKAHVELKPGDFVRIQNSFYIIDEIRKFRRYFPTDYTFYVATQPALDLIELTGSLKSRFQHIDKFAVVATQVTTTVQVLYRNTDVTGLQFGHLWTTLNAGVAAPTELSINSFSREDIIRCIVTFPLVAPLETAVRLWFSGEEYTLVEFPKEGGPAKDGIPARFVLIVPYGFSRVMTKDEFADAEISFRLRT